MEKCDFVFEKEKTFFKEFTSAYVTMVSGAAELIFLNANIGENIIFFLSYSRRKKREFEIYYRKKRRDDPNEGSFNEKFIAHSLKS